MVFGILSGNLELILSDNAQLILSDNVELILSGRLELILSDNLELILSSEFELILSNNAELILSSDLELILLYPMIQSEQTFPPKVLSWLFWLCHTMTGHASCMLFPKLLKIRLVAGDAAAG